MVLIMLFLLTASLYSVASTNFEEIYYYTPPFFNIIYTLSILIDISALVGILLWKKFAIYVYTISQIVWIICESLVLKPTDVGLGLGYFNIILIGLTLWSMYREWKYFD